MEMQKTEPVVVTQVAAGELRDWSSGICDCFSDCKSCCCGWCCMPCLTCDIAGRMGEKCGCCLSCFGCILPMRTKLRTMYGITGSICNDCCASTFCYCCTVCQMDRELTQMGV